MRAEQEKEIRQLQEEWAARIGRRLEDIRFFAEEIAKVDRGIELLREKRTQLEEHYQDATKNFEHAIKNARLGGVFDEEGMRLTRTALRGE